MTRQTLCRDCSDGIFPSLAIIRAEGRYQLVQVSQRVSSRQIVFSQFLEVTPRTRLREAKDDLQAYVARQRSADRQRVLLEARAIIQAGHYVGLDTETTGLDEEAQVVSWAIVGPDGTVAGQGLVKATVPVSESALATHGIREESLVDAPGFGEAWAVMRF
jgi:DNA polymerase III epsilon subunit-like protein